MNCSIEHVGAVAEANQSIRLSVLAQRCAFIYLSVFIYPCIYLSMRTQSPGMDQATQSFSKERVSTGQHSSNLPRSISPKTTRLWCPECLPVDPHATFPDDQLPDAKARGMISQLLPSWRWCGSWWGKAIPRPCCAEKPETSYQKTRRRGSPAGNLRWPGPAGLDITCTKHVISTHDFVYVIMRKYHMVCVYNIAYDIMPIFK